MPTDLFTINYLGSYAGLVAVTYLLVQFFKEPVKRYLSDWWVRLMAVGFALVIQLFTLFVTGNFTMEAIGLAVLNSFLVAITAAGTHNISQPTSDSIVNTIREEGTIYKSRVPEVSPPIVTPQPSAEAESDPAARAVQV